MEILRMDTPLTTDPFASNRDGYALQTMSFAFDGLTFPDLDPPPDQTGVVVTARCPHDELFRMFIPFPKPDFNELGAFTKLMRMVDFGAEIAMENGCHKHDTKGE